MKKFSVLLLGCLIFFACDKDPIELPDPQVKKSILLTGNSYKRWGLTKETLAGTDITAKYQDCELDNFHVFYTTLAYLIDAGDSKCKDNPEPDVVRGYIEFNADTTAMDVSFPDTAYTAKIVELTEEKLRLSIEKEDGIYERTFKKL